MNTRSLWLAALAALAALASWPALAQNAPPATPDAASASRVQRDADNPLRMIIEASKLKTRAKGAEADPAVRKTADARPTAPRAVAVKPAESTPELAASSSPAAVRQAASAMPASPLNAPTANAKAAAALPDSALLAPAASVVVADPAPAPAVIGKSAPAGDTVVAAIALPTLAAPLNGSLRPAPKSPELIDYVEPVLPSRLRTRLRGSPQVVVDLMILADGSVADATVRSSSDKALETLALDAVRQWRYKPGSETQAHAVQLVFAP